MTRKPWYDPRSSLSSLVEMAHADGVADATRDFHNVGTDLALAASDAALKQAKKAGTPRARARYIVEVLDAFERENGRTWYEEAREHCDGYGLASGDTSGEMERQYALAYVAEYFRLIREYATYDARERDRNNDDALEFLDAGQRAQSLVACPDCSRSFWRSSADPAVCLSCRDLLALRRGIS